MVVSHKDREILKIGTRKWMRVTPKQIYDQMDPKVDIDETESKLICGDIPITLAQMVEIDDDEFRACMSSYMPGFKERDEKLYLLVETRDYDNKKVSQLFTRRRLRRKLKKFKK